MLSCLIFPAMKLKPIPILVGASQFTQSRDAFPALDPLGLMIRASRDAFADAGSDVLITIFYIFFVL